MPGLLLSGVFAKEFIMPTSRPTAAKSPTGSSKDREILAAAEEILRARLQRLGTVHNPADAFDFLRMRLGGLVHEEFHALWLDNRHRILDCQRLFIGTVDSASIYPREVVRAALDYNASAVILVHNHPSGVAEPSAYDRAVTRELKEALDMVGVRVLDHVVIGETCVSLAKRGLF